MRYEKVYVGVTVLFLLEGGMRPKVIKWTDGKNYEIDRVKFIDRLPPKTGGVTTKRFTVSVLGQERWLFFERETERWFLEVKII